MPFDLASSAAAANAGTDLISAALAGGKVRCSMATFTCASDAEGTYTMPIRLPKGAIPLFGISHGSATMGGTATLAFGISGSTGKYRAAATHTVTTPTIFGVHAGISTATTAEEQLLLTVAAAALPSSGTLTIKFFWIDPS